MTNQGAIISLSSAGLEDEDIAEAFIYRIFANTDMDATKAKAIYNGGVAILYVSFFL